jgi:hypothetical protein
MRSLERKKRDGSEDWTKDGQMDSQAFVFRDLIDEGLIASSRGVRKLEMDSQAFVFRDLMDQGLFASSRGVRKVEVTPRYQRNR